MVIHPDPDTLVLFSLVTFAVLYVIGAIRLWRSAGIGRGISWQNFAAFAATLLLLVIAMESPLAEAAETMFSAHMIEHEILMVLAAPLLALSTPLAALAWALPRLTISFKSNRLLNAGWVRWIARPLPATVVQAVAIWFWHIPHMFRAANSNEGLHVLQHLCFFGSALLFWHAIHKAGRLRAGAAVGYLFITSAHTNFLGALLTLSPQAVYGTKDGFGLSPLEDQQLGGIIMWVPGGMAYAISALFMAARWISTRRAPPSNFGSEAQASQTRLISHAELM